MKSNAQTLFYEAASGATVLVKKIKRRRQTEPMKFPDPHAALDSCIEHRAGFVFTPAPNLSGN